MDQLEAILAYGVRMNQQNNLLKLFAEKFPEQQRIIDEEGIIDVPTLAVAVRCAQRNINPEDLTTPEYNRLYEIELDTAPIELVTFGVSPYLEDPNYTFLALKDSVVTTTNNDCAADFPAKVFLTITSEKVASAKQYCQQLGIDFWDTPQWHLLAKSLFE